MGYPTDTKSPAQARPHGAVALGRPDHRMLDALRLVVGGRHVERHAVLVNGEARIFRVHGAARFVVSLLEAATFTGAVADAVIERGEEILGERDAFGDLFGAFER